MNDSFDSRRFVSHVVSRWRLITAIAGVFVLGGLVLAIALRPEYDAHVQVMATSLGDLRGKASSLGGLANLADLAGINVGGSGDDVEKSLAILTSRRFTDEFIQNEGVLQALYRNRWDAATKTWKQSGDGVIGALRRSLSGVLRYLSGDEAPTDAAGGAAGSGAPSAWEAFRRFNDLRDVSRDRKTGVITLTIRWRDPVLAAKWANDMIDRVNDELRNIAIGESQERLAYLGAQLESVQTVGLREALSSLTSMEQRKAMLAHVQRAYAFTVVDPAVVPGERASPKRVALVLAALVLGLFVGFLVVSFGYMYGARTPRS